VSETWPCYSIINVRNRRRAGAAVAAAAAADLVVEHAPDGLQEELLPRMAPLPVAVLQARPRPRSPVHWPPLRVLG